MSVLDYLSPDRSPPFDQDDLDDDLEAAFVAWACDPAKPDAVDLGHDAVLSLAELSRRLLDSQAMMEPSACVQLGVPPGVTIGTAAAELLHATIDPDGPRCRSFRSASYYLRGLARLDDDLQPGTGYLGSNTERPRVHADVR